MGNSAAVESPALFELQVALDCIHDDVCFERRSLEQLDEGITSELEREYKPSRRK